MNAVEPTRVLLVDDDESVILPLRHALEARGFLVFTACDGTEALVHVETHSPDVIVLDVVMPRRTGLSVLDKLYRTRGDQLPRLILVSGHDDARIKEFATSRGASRFVGKPYDIPKMVALVDSLALTARLPT